MIFLKIFLWILAVLLILMFPLAAFAGSMSSNPMQRGAGLIPIGLSIAGAVLAFLLITGRIG